MRTVKPLRLLLLGRLLLLLVPSAGAAAGVATVTSSAAASDPAPIPNPSTQRVVRSPPTFAHRVPTGRGAGNAAQKTAKR